MFGPPRLARSISLNIECRSYFGITHDHLPPIDENKRSPAIPELTTMRGSGTLQRHRTRSVMQAIVAVEKSRMECRARTKTAPAMAPVAAAVTPLTKALMPLFRENRR